MSLANNDIYGQKLVSISWITIYILVFYAVRRAPEVCPVCSVIFYFSYQVPYNADAEVLHC
jgi:hypothetical protein